MNPLPPLTCNYGPVTVEEIPARLEKLAAAGVEIEPQWIEKTFGIALRHTETTGNTGKN